MRFVSRTVECETDAQLVDRPCTCRQLIEEDYPWFLNTYNDFPKNIMRADAVRAALGIPYLYH